MDFIEEYMALMYDYLKSLVKMTRASIFASLCGYNINYFDILHSGLLILSLSQSVSSSKSRTFLAMGSIEASVYTASI